MKHLFSDSPNTKNVSYKNSPPFTSDSLQPLQSPGHPRSLSPIDLGCFGQSHSSFDVTIVQLQALLRIHLSSFKMPKAVWKLHHGERFANG